ncbi:hypothetical protein [Afifella sp. IM 167]|uniref:hypothetical protein n=1 Tax=Afifella sp. IM 167 TaxID=2033586 RepID=UPI001CCA374C|nr:hypothetical protein [Afifella sp. IM 167]MBZ8134487.1 hypothetical protein [Afifella sp. IM 167]
MCEVCAIFGAGEHWSDFGRLRNERLPFGDIQHYRQERKRRIAMINEILAPIGLACEDWDGEALSISDAQGRFKIAHTLTDLWPVIEEMSPARIDPLGPGFIGTGLGGTDFGRPSPVGTASHG